MEEEATFLWDTFSRIAHQNSVATKVSPHPQDSYGLRSVVAGSAGPLEEPQTHRKQLPLLLPHVKSVSRGSCGVFIPDLPRAMVPLPR